MRESWLDRETTVKLKMAVQAAAYPEAARFRLSGLAVPEMVLSGRKAASLMLSSPLMVAEWQRDSGKNLAQRLVAAINGTEKPVEFDGVAVSDILPVWPRLLLSCGAGTSRFWTSSMSPGLEKFAGIAKQCGLWHQDIACTGESDLLLFPEVINKSSKLAVVSFPSYPGGATMSRDSWWELCAAFEESGARLVNYNRSASPQPAACRFHDIAAEFAGLSWLEICDPCAMLGKSEGWSLVAVIGSDDFVADFRAAGGGGDQLLVPTAAGVLAAFESGANEVSAAIMIQRSALAGLSQVLSSAGLKASMSADTGYHALWLVPKRLDGEEISDAAAFNAAMTRRYSLCGLPFGKAIAYSPLDMPIAGEWLAELAEVLVGADIGY